MLASSIIQNIVHPSFEFCSRRSIALIEAAVSSGQPYKGVEQSCGVLADHIVSLSDANNIDIVRSLSPSRTPLEVMRECSRAIKMVETTVALGGDHSLSEGSVAAQLETYGDKLGVIVVDAHADVNTKKTSPSGNTHGMWLARLLGLESSISRSLLRPEQLFYLGIRDVDQGEWTHINELGIPHLTTRDVSEIGPSVVKLIDSFDYVHVSWDIDVSQVAGTGTPVGGGLTYQETIDLADVMGFQFKNKLVGMDMVEVNTKDFPCPFTMHLAKRVLSGVLDLR